MSLIKSAPHFNKEEAALLVLDYYGIEGVASTLPSERDQNFRIETADGDQYVFKIANRFEEPAFLEAQNRAMTHLSASSDLTPRVLAARSGEEIIMVPGDDGEFLARLVSWLPGIPLATQQRQTSELLIDLGRAVGSLDRAFAGFDHDSLHREFHWDLALGREVVGRHRPLIDDLETGALVDKALALFESTALPKLSSLRRSVIHNDANDHNVLVGGGVDRHTRNQQVTGIIDFGDMVHSFTVGNLAVALAYAVFDKPSPLAAACRIVEGYHAKFPLHEDEIEALFGLVCLRLATSICIAAHQTRQRPDDPYLGISQEPIRRTLPRLLEIHPRVAQLAFRQACGLEPDPGAANLRNWLEQKRGTFSPVLPPSLAGAPMIPLDLGIGTTLVSGNPEIYSEPHLTWRIVRKMAANGASVGVGLYDEPRIIYTAEAFHREGEPDRNRTVHLGIDLYVMPGTKIHAPLDGTVHLFGNNAKPQDYGPVIILEHETGKGDHFFTLYGHLSTESLQGLEEGKRIKEGEPFASVGYAAVNGGWPPHLHFQIITDLLDKGLDFPGVCAHSERDLWCRLSPDPDLVLGLPEGVLPPPAKPKDETLGERRRLIGPNLSIGYHDPVKVERGWMQYLYDETGRRYLDAYNNVPHLGHCHPRVVEAATEQMAVLNTNTRYLHDTINRFAERLTATMPEPLSVCYFVNSASEGNELALRLARAFTGLKEMIVLEAAYHGHCNALIDISPYKHDGPGGRGRPTWVHTAPIPDTYRGLYKADDPDAGPKYAGHVEAIAEGLLKKGKGLCGFIAESYPSVGGQIIVPPGYLKTVYQAVREAGGVCIADEVQTGYGRIGTHFYAFEAQGAVPDIVVLGKPIGNGHPLSAVVTTPEIAEAFDNGMEFFSTFGGNTVSCAVGLAVLEETLSSNLQGHALEVGKTLLAELAPLKERYPIVGDVRGSGLFVGVELVRDRETLEPAGSEASFVVDRMRDKGILAGTDGPYHNVVKIRPPMPFTNENADQLATTMAAVLEEEFGE